jgi:hypothetical protein
MFILQTISWNVTIGLLKSYGKTTIELVLRNLRIKLKAVVFDMTIQEKKVERN